jgi:hypothetical protein
VNGLVKSNLYNISFFFPLGQDMVSGEFQENAILLTIREENKELIILLMFLYP